MPVRLVRLVGTSDRGILVGIGYSVNPLALAMAARASMGGDGVPRISPSHANQASTTASNSSRCSAVSGAAVINLMFASYSDAGLLALKTAANGIGSSTS